MIRVFQEGSVRIKPVRDFKDAGLHPVMFDNVVLAGYKVPTPVQAFTLGAIYNGYDMVACAQTGKSFVHCRSRVISDMPLQVPAKLLRI